jgi:hypothetical protein
VHVREKTVFGGSLAFGVILPIVKQEIKTPVGGIGTIEGAIIEALVYFLMREYLGGFGTWYLIILGAFTIFIMLKAPRGIWGTIAHRYHIQLFGIKRVVQSVNG